MKSPPPPDLRGIPRFQMPEDEFAPGGVPPHFGGRVETDFRAWFYTSQMERAQVSLGLAQALVFVSVGLDLMQNTDAADRASALIKLAMICPLLLATMWISRTPRWQYLFPHFMCASIIAVGIAFSVINLEVGFGLRYDALVLVTVFAYFLGGLAPTFASATGLCLLGMHIYLSSSRGISFEQMAYESLFLLAINAVGMISANLTERSVREAFWHYQTMTQLSELDALTRLLNRRGFDRRYAELWERAQRERKPLTLAFVDIDHFKSVNDHYGHEAGDDALRQVARVLNQQGDPAPTLCARLGGDEFISVWYDLGGPTAELLADRIPRAIEELRLHNEGTPQGVLTASVGLAVCEPNQLAAASECMRRADRALYEAKRSGRNRTSLAQQEPKA
jgi:diguanylate cyclase (GGDEF)-like protein